MKTSFKRKLAMIMTFALIVPLFWNLNVAEVKAATPSFVQTNVQIVGTGEIYQLEIKDKVDKSTYKWTSSNKTVATVTSKGLVTSVNKGSSTIKCKITYPSKKTKTISCKVTVTIPATDISITNSTLVNGAHVMLLGATMDFDTQVIPANSSDQVFWSVENGDAECIRIDDASQGKITAVKAGKVSLKATAATSATQAAADLSFIDDSVIIEVVGPKAIVKSADIITSSQIQIVFDSPVNQTTVITTTNKLSDNIEITLSKDTKGVLATDPGDLTATLSADKKTLIINTKNSLNGYYGINFTNKILTTDGTPLEAYYKKMFYVDTTPPDYAGTTTDDSGYIATVNFTEALDFTNFKISDAAIVSTSGETATANTLATLKNVLNYTIATDKKSISIDLSKITSTDYGKYFSIAISGVTDTAGNLPAKVYISAYLRMDTTGKPQAQVLSVARTSYNVITATFDRSIQFGGYIQVAGGASIYGVIDTTNNKKVNYTLSETEASYTGAKTVGISSWTSYNVIKEDISAKSMHPFYVDFTTDKTSPLLLTNSYDSTKGILTLTYSEEVVLTVPAGSFNAGFTSVTDDIKPSTPITYTKIAHTEGNNIIKLQLAGISLVGTYTFNLNQGFVTDNFKNVALTSSVLISTTGSSSTELPGPYSITQSSSNLSQIYVKFLYKLDKTSAETISNYTVTGLTITKAELVENATTGATVVLTVIDGTIEVEVARPVKITGVKGYNNSYSEITAYSSAVTLKENKKPYFISATFDTTTKNTVRLNFSEAVQGTLLVKVTQTYGTTSTLLTNSVTLNGSTAIVVLSNTPTLASTLSIEILNNTITDLSGNTVSPMTTYINVPVIY